MKVLIPFKDESGLASSLRYAGYDAIEFTDDIKEFSIRCHGCDAIFNPKQENIAASPESFFAMSIAHKRGIPIVSWSESHKDYDELFINSISLDVEFYKKADFKPDHRKLPKILIVGPGRCGKDSLGEFIHKYSKHTYAGSTSKFLAKYVAEYMHIKPEQAYSLRHEHRQRWFEIGNATRESDHGLLQKEALAVGNVVAGIRDFREIAWACYNEIYDHIIWIDADVEPDPTLTFTSHDIAVTLQGKKTKLTIIKNNKDSQFFNDARKLIEEIQ